MSTTTPLSPSPLTSSTSQASSWLGAIGFTEGMTVAGWQLADVELRTAQGDPGAVLRFRQGEAEIPVQILPANPQRKVFARTRSFDFSHLPIAPTLNRAAEALLKQLVAAISGRDDGQLPRPPAVKSTDDSSTGSSSSGGGYGYGNGREPNEDPALRREGERHFLDFFTVDVNDLHRFPNAIQDMYDGTLGGLIIRGVYSEEEMARVYDRIENREKSFIRRDFPVQYKTWFLGRFLDDSTDPELPEYLADTPRFRENLRSVFEGMTPYEDRLEDVLGRISAGAAVRIPSFRDGRSYAPATIRMLPPGGQISTHVGKEAGTRPAYTHLNTVVDSDNQISMFLTAQAPEAGGNLIVYSLKWSDIDERHIIDGRTAVEPLLETAEWAVYTTRPGDLLVFDGGRYFHRVSVVQGSRNRCTIGGFAMFSPAHDTLYYYS